MIVRTNKLLNFDNSWRFKSPGPIPQGVVRAFSDLIEKVAAQGDAWDVVEQCKSRFCGNASHRVAIMVFQISEKRRITWARDVVLVAVGLKQAVRV